MRTRNLFIAAIKALVYVTAGIAASGDRNFCCAGRRAVGCLPQRAARWPLAILAFLLVGLSGAALGQGPCDARWLPGEGLPGVNGGVAAMVN